MMKSFKGPSRDAAMEEIYGPFLRGLPRRAAVRRGAPRLVAGRQLGRRTAFRNHPPIRRRPVPVRWRCAR
jgi:hypothetical protein